MIDIQKLKFEDTVIYKGQPHIICGFGDNQVLLKDQLGNVVLDPVSCGDIEPFNGQLV